MDDAEAWGICDNTGSHTHPSPCVNGNRYAINANDRNEVTAIGFEVADFDNDASSATVPVKFVIQARYTGCLINNVCYNDGDANPNNACLICDAQVSTSAWTPVPLGTACGSSDATNCNAADTCDGAGTCVDRKKAAGIVCRAVNGLCDLAEACNGTTNDCPVDAFKTVGTSCRASAGQCDVAETCPGTSGACPADVFASNTTPCTGTSQSGLCDNNTADHCSGTANTCVDAFKSAGTSCRASVGQCDAAETCPGTSGACPADIFASDTTPCTGTSQSGLCDNDPADHCSGTANTCVDAFKSAGTSCRASVGQCDAAETCPGTSGVCPDDAFASDTTPCTGTSQGGTCDNDPADHCSGTANTCVDVYKANGTSCDDGLYCNGADTCAAGACTTHAGDPCAGGAECNRTCNELAGNCYDPMTTACTSDGEVCTDDFCNGAGACEHTNNTASCDDGLYCNGADTCSGGVCTHAGDPCAGGAECNRTCNELAGNCYDPMTTACTSDGEVCTDDFCNGAGACEHPNNTASCDDGLYCNGADTCAGGVCTHAGDPCTSGGECANLCNEADDNCNNPLGTSCTADTNVCTDDVCDGNGACTHPNNTASCDDGLFCNGADTCAGGVCTHAGDPCTSGGECANLCNEADDNCNNPLGTSCTADTNVCTDDVCDGNGACTHPNNTASCDDGLFCNGADTCAGGVCTHAGDPCTSGGECANLCNEADDNCNNPLGTSCTADTNVCTDDVCDGNGACTHPNNTASCDDGLFCNGADTCAGGVCTHAGDPCTSGGECANLCNEADDNCNNPLGTSCTADTNVCTDDVCDGNGACTHPNNTASCDDGLFCNGADTCAGGVCTHAGDPCTSGGECANLCNEADDNCNNPLGTSCTADTNVCTDDVCDGNGACTHPNNTASCDDGLFCNGADTCAGGVCTHAGDPCTSGGECANLCNEADDNCNNPLGTSCTADTNVCTDDVCDGNGACTHPNNTASCDDGLFCNGADTCAGGVCTHAGDPCTSGGECANLCNEADDNCNNPLGTSCTADTNVCTDDVCDGNGACTHPNNTASCDDGLFCNGADTCAGGVCTHAGDPCTSGGECANLCNEADDNCNNPLGTSCTADTNVCTDDVCDGNGACTHPNNTASCDDGLFCNGADTCAGGVCTHAGDPCTGGGECANLCNEADDNCNNPLGTSCTADTNVCTDDVCDGNGACTHPNNTASCDDGLFCNGADTCAGGVCTHAGDPCTSGGECANLCNEADDNCNNPLGTACTADTNVCTDDVCDGNGACTHPNNTASCDDGLFCNGADTCAGGVCTHAGDPCAGGAECTDLCNEADDNCNNPLGTACTADTNVCTDDVCDGAGACAHPNNTASCDDGLFCNGADTCAGGVCTHAGDPCTSGGECTNLCNEADDNCNNPLGTSCTADTNVCTDDVCDGNGACAHPNNTASCDDGDLCTYGDHCVSGACVGTAYSCDDHSSCTNDICDGSGGCSYTNTGACDITGHVYYYRDLVSGEPSTKPVPSVGIDRTGDSSPEATTNASGGYEFDDLVGTFTVRTLPKYGIPRASDHNGAITSYDATLIAQHVVHRITLSTNQQIAGDATGNGGLSSLDASYVAQFAVRMIDHLPVATSQLSDWKFLCNAFSGCVDGAYPFTPISGPATANFYGILYGDVSGNWQKSTEDAFAGLATGPEAAAAEQDSLTAETMASKGSTMHPCRCLPDRSRPSLRAWVGLGAETWHEASALRLAAASRRDPGSRSGPQVRPGETLDRRRPDGGPGVFPAARDQRPWRLGPRRDVRNAAARGIGLDPGGYRGCAQEPRQTPAHPGHGSGKRGGDPARWPFRFRSRALVDS